MYTFEALECGTCYSLQLITQFYLPPNTSHRPTCLYSRALPPISW